MIFFGAPSVNQPKHETLFGNDDHYGFIKTLVGKVYEPRDVSKECKIYYNKKGDKFWGQIITLLHWTGLKKLDGKHLLLLAWNFVEEIVRDLRASGFKGDIIVPLPNEVHVR